MIEVAGLEKQYGAKTALNGISFQVGEGEIFGLLGTNGAGKTTTIKILTGQLRPTNGCAKLFGEDVTGNKNAFPARIGVVPEQTNLYERLTVSQNLSYFCRLYGSDLKNVDLFLEKVGLLNERNTQVKKLSKGMKQKVLLVRALLHSPKLLFLDEPTSGLDPASANDIHRLLRSLNNAGVTILLTSHNMEEVDRLCHRVAFINGGLIAAMGEPAKLKLEYANNQMRVQLADGGMVEEVLLPMEGEESAAVLAEWVTAGKIKAIHSCEPTLAEIFLKVTGREL